MERDGERHAADIPVQQTGEPLTLLPPLAAFLFFGLSSSSCSSS